MQLRPIDIDIDVNRYIEQRRTSFGQTPNDILRELFGYILAQTSGQAGRGQATNRNRLPVTGTGKG